MRTQFNIFLALSPGPHPQNYDILNMDKREIDISTTHRSARKTGPSELWRNLSMSTLGVLPTAAKIIIKVTLDDQDKFLEND